MEGVLEVKNEHFWSSGFNQIAGSLQVRVSRNTNEQKVLAMIVLKLFPVVPKCSVQVIHSWVIHSFSIHLWKNHPFFRNFNFLVMSQTDFENTYPSDFHEDLFSFYTISGDELDRF